MTDLRTRSKAEEKLSRIPKGHWRNKYVAVNAMLLVNPDGSIDPAISAGEEYFGHGKWPSHEVAEEIAARDACNPNGDTGSGDAKYLGPVFFPDDGGGQ